MKSIKDIPFRFPTGAVTWDALGQMLSTWQREVFAEFDIRNPQAFPDALTATEDGVTLGDGATPAGRDVGVPTLVSRISDAGRAADQRFLPQVSAGNRLSAQNIQPLSSTGTEAGATVSIAAHTVQYGFGTVAYNSGSIAGLTANTLYFIYADDPEFAGGAVSYAATTTAPTVVAANGRYYVGSITTAITAAEGDISAILNSNPCEVTTTAAHGFATGNEVEFSGVGGMTQLNGNTYTITVVDADTFTLDATDATAYGVYTSGGTVTRVSTPTGGGGGGGWDYQIP